MKKSRWEEARDWFILVVWKPLREKDWKQEGRKAGKKVRSAGAPEEWKAGNKWILVMCSMLCVALVFVGVFLLLRGGEDKRGVEAADKKQQEQGKQPDEEDGKGQNQGQAMDSEDGQEPSQEANTAPEVTDPRAAFAVQPGNVPSNFEAGEEKVVYLTFDDGPSRNTERVLEILDRYQAKATFFITAQWPEYKGMIKEAYDRGHTIGLHTYSHDYAAVYSSVDAYFQDLWAVGELAKEQIGYVPCFIRFPGGASNTISANYSQGIMTQLSALVQEQGFQYYDWNASSGDGGVCTTEELIQNSTSYTQNKIMLLCHDSGAKDNTVEALPTIIEHFQSLGYTFKAIDRESYVVHHGVNN